MQAEAVAMLGANVTNHQVHCSLRSGCNGLPVVLRKPCWSVQYYMVELTLRMIALC